MQHHGTPFGGAPSRRRFLGGAAAAAALAAGAAVPAWAQGAREFGRGAAPTRYPDADFVV
ncbi:MAG: twin-arginine translocation signal domain-containing protein, partial [Acetobacteraceae bacterium]|nr:twin-arginine translocation signal domain-containing protein [Acetobacteraceae bacterium]